MFGTIPENFHHCSLHHFSYVHITHLKNLINKLSKESGFEDTQNNAMTNGSHPLTLQSMGQS